MTPISRLQSNIRKLPHFAENNFHFARGIWRCESWKQNKTKKTGVIGQTIDGRADTPSLSIVAVTVTVNATEAVVFSPLLQYRGSLTESSRMLLPVDRMKQKCPLDETSPSITPVSAQWRWQLYVVMFNYNVFYLVCAVGLPWSHIACTPNRLLPPPLSLLPALLCRNPPNMNFYRRPW